MAHLWRIFAVLYVLAVVVEAGRFIAIGKPSGAVLAGVSLLFMYELRVTRRDVARLAGRLPR